MFLWMNGPGEVRRRFGESVRAARLAAGMSQEALAEQAGLHRTYVGGVERGERNVSLVNITALARGLSVPPSALFANWDDELHDQSQSPSLSSERSSSDKGRP